MENHYVVGTFKFAISMFGQIFFISGKRVPYFIVLP